MKLIKSNYNRFLGSLIKKGNKVAAKRILTNSLKMIDKRKKLIDLAKKTKLGNHKLKVINVSGKNYVKKPNKKKVITSARILTNFFESLETHVEAKTVVRGKGRKARTTIIPFPLKLNRQRFLKIKWLVESAKEDKKQVNFSEKLSAEMWNVLYDRKKSKTLAKKKAVTKVVLENRSNSHFRW